MNSIGELWFTCKRIPVDISNYDTKLFNRIGDSAQEKDIAALAVDDGE